MLLKTAKILVGYVLGCIFTASFIVFAYYYGQMPDNGVVAENIRALSIVMMIFSIPVIALLAPFAYFKNIKSPYFYALTAIFSVFFTLLFIPKYQGIEGQPGEWAPFVSFIAAAVAGYLFWLFAIRTKN